MSDILSPVKNSFYDSDTIDLVTRESEISSNKHRGISLFAFLIHFLCKRSSFWSSSDWHCFSLKVKSFGTFQIGEFEMFLNIYINMHLTHMILYCYGCEMDL